MNRPPTQPKPRRAGSKPDLFWHLIFLDVTIQFLRFGGMAVIDVLLHGLLMAAAGVVLVKRCNLRRIDPVFHWIFGGFIFIGLIQMIPLPPFLFDLLAPVKSRVVAVATEIVPGLDPSTSITMLPSYHLYCLGRLLLDVVLIFMVLSAPRPHRKVVRSWIYVLATTMGVLATLTGQDIINENSLLGAYRDTHGGLINANHFGTMIVVLAVLVAQYGLVNLRGLFTSHYSGGSRRKDDLARNIRQLLICGLILFIALLGFTYGSSRSGVMSLVLCFGVFSALTILRWAKRSGPVVFIASIVALIALLVFAPIGRNFDDFTKQEHAMDATGRVELTKTALAYLGEWPVLGTGMGSAESILDPVTRKINSESINVRKFHNDYLQVAIEYGWLGIGLLLWLLVNLFRRFMAGYRSGDFGVMVYSAAVLASSVAFAAHSLFSSPLRVNGIRYLIIVVTALAFRSRKKTDVTRAKTLTVVGGLFMIGFGIVTHTLVSGFDVRKSEHPEIDHAVRYGYHYRIGLYRANRSIGGILEKRVRKVDQASIELIRSSLNDHLPENPFSLKGLGLWVMADVLERISLQPELNRSDFLEIKAKAERIRELGKDRNLTSKSALLFVYAMYEPILNEDERSEWQNISKPLEQRIQRRIEERGLDNSR